MTELNVFVYKRDRKGKSQNIAQLKKPIVLNNKTAKQGKLCDSA
jgi:hypothetical protein